MDLRAIVLSLVCGIIFETLSMSVRDNTFSSNCKIDERTHTDGGILALRKSIILANCNRNSLRRGPGEPGGGNVNIQVLGGG